MQLCDYGCGQPAKYQFKNGKWCCNSNQMKCPVVRKKNSIQIKKIYKDPESVYNSISYKNKQSNRMKHFNKEMWGNPESKFNSDLYKENQSNIMKNMWRNPNSGFNLILYREKQSKSSKKAHKKPNNVYNSILYKNKLKLNVENIKIKYPFFSKIEEIRYNPNKPSEKEIQVHCKNHECENSKEKEGWFTPTYIQLYERIRQLESKEGNGGSYFYCSQHCKDTCPLYGLQGDPYKDNNLPYTNQEYQTFRTFVLERDKYICQFCGKLATHVHHERPQKLEPFYALDPDFAWSCCKKCHYEKGHQGECSTGNLAKIVCSVESQKFLN